MAEKKANTTGKTGAAKKKSIKKTAAAKKPRAGRAAPSATLPRQDGNPRSSAEKASSINRDGAEKSVSRAAAETPLNSEKWPDGRALPWIALVFGALAMCVGGYAWYLAAVGSKTDAGQRQTRIDSIEQRLDGFGGIQDDITRRVDQLRDLLARSEGDSSDQIRNIRTALSDRENVMRQQLEIAEKRLSEKTDAFRVEFDTLTDSITNLRDELSRNLDGWTLAEAEQLVFIASQRLQLAGEIDSAETALRLADDRLSRLADQRINEIRNLISKDIAALESIPRIDVIGVLNALEALADRVDDLPLAGDVDAKSISRGDNGDGIRSGGEQSPQEGDSAADQYLQPVTDAVAAFLSNLGDLIQVEKNGESIKPIISAEARRLTYQKAKLIIESAQIAFIRKQAGLYANRIAAVRSWVNENFDTSKDKTQIWMKRLDRIGAVNPDSPIPDISETLNAIRALGGGSE